MELDKLTRMMFRSSGYKAVARMARGVPVDMSDPSAVAAALELAKLAREFLKLEYRLTVVMSEGEVLDQARMERFINDSTKRAPRVNPPSLDDLRPTTKVREGIGRDLSHRQARRSSSAAKAERQGKMPYVIDGVEYMLPPSIIEMLKKAQPNG